MHNIFTARISDDFRLGRARIFTGDKTYQVHHQEVSGGVVHIATDVRGSTQKFQNRLLHTFRQEDHPRGVVYFLDAASGDHKDTVFVDSRTRSTIRSVVKGPNKITYVLGFLEKEGTFGDKTEKAPGDISTFVWAFEF